MCGPKNEEEKKNNTTQVSSCHSPGQDLPMFSYISHVKSQGQGPLRSDPSPLMLTRFPSSLSLKHAKLPSTPGLLHLLFLLPGMLFPCIHMAHSLTACWSPLKCHLDTEACPSHPSHSPPVTPSEVLCLPLKEQEMLTDNEAHLGTPGTETGLREG